MQNFYGMVDRLNECTEQERPELERLLLETYECERVVMALDMSGFSETVRREGILPFLCRIRRMQTLCGPLVVAANGVLVKQVADNLMVVFEDPVAAVKVAVGIHQMLAAQQPHPGGQSPIRVCIGLDVGRILLIPGADCFGDAVNVAYKLGEDVARAGEVLITEAMREKLGEDSPFQLEALTLSISGIEIPAHKVIYSAPASSTQM